MKALPTISKLLLLLSSFAVVSKADDCTKFVDELSTFCRYNKNTGVNQLRKIRFLTDRKTLKKDCDIFKDVPNTDIEECEEEEEENKNIKMLDFFSDKQDDYNIFNIVSRSKDGSVCEDCVKWVLNKDTIDIFPEESTAKKAFSSILEMEIQTFENLEKKSFLLINFAYSNEKIGNGLRILVNGATKLDLTKSAVSSGKTIGYKLKLKPNKSYLVQIEYIYDEQKEGLRFSERQMIDDGDDDTPSAKSFAQIKLLYLKRGDFLKFTGNVKGEPDDDEDDDEIPTDGTGNTIDNDNNIDADNDNSQKDDDDNTKNIDNDSNLDAKPSEDKTFVDGDGDNAGDDNAGDDNAGDDNAGDDNAGDDNVGDDNAGDDNAGDDNVGDDNAGDDNAGDDNAGDDNAGNDNVGDDNAGDNVDNVTGDNNNIDNTNNPEENTNYGNADDNNTSDNNTSDNNNNNETNNDNNNDDAVETEKLEESSGYGNKVLIIGGIGLVASIFYCRSSASSKAKRQYAVADNNLELDDLEKGIVDVDREFDYDEDDMNHSNNGPHDLNPDEEAFFEEMSDDDEGYETYGFTKF
jgi:hypothetical protein